METDKEEYEKKPLKIIPGNYGSPWFGAIKDRLDFFWFQGETKFWTSRKEKDNSTIFRVNVVPGPPGFPTTKAIMLLDQKSFPILFDTTKVEKKNLLLGNYVPSLSFFGGIRPCAYLDPSEERHTKLKSFIMDLIKTKADKWVPEMEAATAEIFPKWEKALRKKGKAEVNKQTAQVACNVLIRTLVGRDPKASNLKSNGPFLFQAWYGLQLAPIATTGGVIPHVLEELFLHTFPIPYLFISCFYRRLVKFFKKHGAELLELAESKYGLDKRDALHNIVFFVGFNAFGGFNLFLPTMMGHVGRAGREVHEEMAAEARGEAARDGGGKLTAAGVMRMELIRSAVYESLRMSPPVPYQYAKAKEDLVVETHDGRYSVKKGEILGGCQPIAMRDPEVFERPDTFVASRFVGESGRRLLKYVVWGNGPADGQTSVSNKQCAAADLVPFLAQAFLACVFLRYDSFTALPPVVRGNNITVYLNSLNKRE